MPKTISISSEELSARRERLAKRKQVGEALHASEIRYRRLFESAKDGILILDARSGQITDANPFLLTLLGYPAEDFIGRRLWEIGTFADVARSQDAFRRLQEQGYVRYEYLPLQSKDGRRVEVEFVSNVYTAGRDEVIQCNIRDIAARKRAEEALTHSHQELQETLRELQQSRNMLQVVIESIPIQVFWKDLSLRFLGCNTSFARDGGFHQPSELVGLDDYSMSWREQADLYQADDRRVIESRRPSLNIVEQHTTSAGNTLWVNTSKVPLSGSDGEVFGVLGVYEDITERKLAESALKDSEERYRSLFDGVPIGLYRTAPDGQILDANPALVEIFGYPDRESLLAVNAGDLYVDAAQRTQVLEALAHSASAHHFEAKMRRRDETVIWVRVTARPIQAPDGRMLYIEGSMEDVTEHKRMEEQYLQAQKMEMVGRLAGGVAHDFNNVLTVISGHASLAGRSLPPDAVAHADIEQVIRATERAAQLTRQLLSFSRRQIIEQKVIDLNHLILEMHRMLRRLIGEDIELVTVPRHDLGVVKADPGQIEQVLVNLSVNARDAMPHGGKLTIETANVTLDEDYVRQHAGVSAGEYVQLAVNDTGTGMTKEVKAHIFEPFFTTKEMGQGTGLGLATVYGIVKQHLGHIEVYSEPGEGTAFKIYLPRVEAAPASPAPREDVTELPRGHETVLVVEDDAIVRRLTVRSLIALGYTVLEAGDGKEALQVSQSHAGTIDLLLTDVIMPQMNGNRLAAELKAIRPDLAVLFTSGYTDDTIAHRGVLDDGVAFLQKPFTAASLARKVHDVLHGPKGEPRSPETPHH
jgi:two-component system, cell cycle sensor histidine kinase and response regulator CckA